MLRRRCFHIMLNIHRHKPLLYYPLLQQHYASSSPFSLRFCSASNSFVVSYLIKKFGFSQDFASKAFNIYGLRFKTSENPDSVVSFFQNRGFSNSQIHDMIKKAPWLLSSDPAKRLLPKFHFFLSKGISNSDFVELASKNPKFLRPSLDKQIIPSYELVYRFLQSHKQTCDLVIRNPNFYGVTRIPHNIRMLVEYGISEPNIIRLIRTRFRVCGNPDLLKVVEELKDLGFDPSKSTFAIALLAKVAVTGWNERVDTFKKWGWSDEVILNTFRKYPYCMIASIDKVNLIMSFWVNQLGWDAHALAKAPNVFTASFESLVIPRAAVVQFLLRKGLRKKNASLTRPFVVSKKLFLENYIIRFVEDSSHLLKLYEEKLKLAYAREALACSSTIS